MTTGIEQITPARLKKAINWTHTPQTGTPGHCEMAQIWDEDGRSIAQIEPTADPESATLIAEMFANAPANLLRLLTKVDNLESFIATLVAANETHIAIEESYRNRIAELEPLLREAKPQVEVLADTIADGAKRFEVTPAPIVLAITYVRGLADRIDAALNPPQPEPQSTGNANKSA